MPSKRSAIVGIDIGSSKVAVCVGTRTEIGVDIIGLGQSPSFGIRKGMVVDIEETVSSIGAALEEAERMSGVALTDAYVGLNGTHVSSVLSKGVIAVSRADGDITAQDVDRVIEAARAIPAHPNREIIHVIPKSFTIDGQEGIRDPIGMSGTRLEVEAHVISGSINAIKNITTCVTRAGLHINGLVYTPLATANLLLTKRQKEIGVALIDIGANSTSLTIFEEGDILHTVFLPVGSAHITNDLAIGLKTTIDTAELVKIKYGSAMPERISEKTIIDLAKFDKNDDQVTEARFVAEIIEARLSEIFLMVRDELQKVEKEGMLPAGIVLTGSGAKLDGVVELCKESLKLPAQIGQPAVDLSGMIDKADDPVYATAVGLMMWGLDDAGVQAQSFHAVGKGNAALSGVIDKVTGMFKHFLP